MEMVPSGIGRSIARIERTLKEREAVRNLALFSLAAAPPISFLLMALRPSPRQMWAQRWPTIAFVGLYQMAFHRSVAIEGLEHLPKAGPVILAGNHINKTAMDAMLIGSRILAERGVLPKFVSVACPPNRMLRHFVRLMGENEGVVLPIQEGATTNIMIDFLRNPQAFGREQPILGIFPVGSADKDFEKHMKTEWHTSAAVAAIETGAPIVPFFIKGLPYHWGPLDMVKAATQMLSGGKAFEFKIRFGPAIRTESVGPERAYKDVTEQVRLAVLNLANMG
jgi:1-acyl-sn-glycerol-3-phosphate acyltransferase